MGSVWPSTLAHAAANAQAGIALLVLAPAGNSLLRPPYGLIEVVPIAALGLVLLATGRLYLVTLAHEATLTGAPIMRPLAWIAPSDADSVACDDEFLVGDALLVAPVLDQGATSRSVLLPPGAWFAWDSGRLFQGGQRVSVPVALDTIPVFVRAGTVVPHAAIAQHSDGIADQPVTLHVYLSEPGQSATMELWDDDDHPDAEQRGSFGAYQIRASWQAGADVVTVSMERARGQLPWRYPGCRVSVHLPSGWRVAPLDDGAGGAGVSLVRGDTFILRYRVHAVEQVEQMQHDAHGSAVEDAESSSSLLP